jgi:hypothetical protein
MEYGLVNGFIDHLDTLNAIPDLRNLQITTAHAKSSQSALTSLFLKTASNKRDSSASVVTPLPAG